MRRISTLALVVLALASCGGSASERDIVSSAPGPTGPSGATSTGEAPARSAHSPRPGKVARFNTASVKMSFLEKSFFGAKSQVVYFIAKGAGRHPLRQAKACVVEYLRKAPSAYCFAFSSERSFRFSGVSKRPPAKMERPCWVAYWGKPSGRRPIGSASNPAAVPLHCPDQT
jgi:hypothetical protein